MEAMSSNENLNEVPKENIRLDKLQDGIRIEKWHEITEGYKQKISKQDKTIQDLSERKIELENQVLILERQRDGQQTERTAIITLSGTGQVDIVLDGPWRFSDMREISPPFRRAIRKHGIEENAEAVQKLKDQEERMTKKDEKKQERQKQQEHQDRQRELREKERELNDG